MHQEQTAIVAEKARAQAVLHNLLHLSLIIFVIRKYAEAL